MQTISISHQDVVMINYNRSIDNLYGQPGSENQGFLDGVLWSANIIMPITYVDAGEVKKNENIYMLRNSEVRIAANNLDRTFYYNELTNQIDERINAITNGMSVVGSAQKRLDMQDEFNKTLMDTVTKGVGMLVDADMNETSTRIKALETQQQLSVQALNIANSAPEAIMQLFR